VSPEHDAAATAILSTGATDSSQFRSPRLQQIMSAKGRVASPVRNGNPPGSFVPNELEGTNAFVTDKSALTSIEFSDAVVRDGNSSSSSKISIADGVDADKSTKLFANGYTTDAARWVEDDLMKVSDNSTWDQFPKDKTTEQNISPDDLGGTLLKGTTASVDLTSMTVLNSSISVEKYFDVLQDETRVKDEFAPDKEQDDDDRLLGEHVSHGSRRLDKTDYGGSRKECFVDKDVVDGGIQYVAQKPNDSRKLPVSDSPL